MGIHGQSEANEEKEVSMANKKLNDRLVEVMLPTLIKHGGLPARQLAWMLAKAVDPLVRITCNAAVNQALKAQTEKGRGD